jgi:hypothetical protein
MKFLRIWGFRRGPVGQGLSGDPWRFGRDRAHCGQSRARRACSVVDRSDSRFCPREVHTDQHRSLQLGQ